MDISNIIDSPVSLSPAVEKTLQSIEELERNGANYWPVPREVGKILYSIIKNTGAKSALEIGTSSGYSGIFMASAFQQFGGHLYTIESHPDRLALGAKHFAQAELTKQITQIPGHAPEVYTPDYQKPDSLRNQAGELHPNNQFNPLFYNLKFDLIFLDGTKKQHIEFFKHLEPHFSSQVIIVTDKLISHHAEIQPYFAYVDALPGFQSESLTIGAGLLITSRKT